MKALIEASEASSTRKIKEEEKRVGSKFDNIYQILLKKKAEIQTVKEEIEVALTKADEFEFLEVGLDESLSPPFQAFDLTVLDTPPAQRDDAGYRGNGASRSGNCGRTLKASLTYRLHSF